jgi:hypothetical protein
VVIRRLADKSVRPTWFVALARKADSSVSSPRDARLRTARNDKLFRVGQGDAVARARVLRFAQDDNSFLGVYFVGAVIRDQASRYFS